MGKIVLGKDEYRDKVFACWLGKNIGGTLGAPYESRKYVNNLTFYNPVPKNPTPNDDLDLQLIWLQMLEEKGVPPRLPDFAEYWRKYLSAYPWNEYGFCMRNLERGLMPPVSGWFENYYVDEMGSPIRSEIWACLAPADPQRAAALAWMDSAMDHAGGEGMYGEMFWASVESAAFVLSEPRELIRLGLAMIPPSCSISRVIREAVWCWEHGKSWAEARERIATTYGHQQPCNAIPNHGFTILGWLYGKDFGSQLCHAVNCGYDTDCTGATLGSVLGIFGGTSYIPQRWSDPVGRGITVHKFTRKSRLPKSLDELTDRTLALAERFLAEKSKTVTFGASTALSPDLRSILFRNEEAIAALRQDIRSAVAVDNDLEIILHYNGDPVLYPGISRKITVSCRQNGASVKGQAKLHLPQGWQDLREESSDESSFHVTASETGGSNSIGVSVELEGRNYSAKFTVLGPDVATGFPSATTIEYCPKCSGRKGSCIC